jgi:hypothetical protein
MDSKTFDPLCQEIFMRNPLFYFAVIAALLARVSLAGTSDTSIPVFGQGSVSYVPASSFQDSLKSALSSIQDSLLPVLETHNTDHSLPWTVQTIGVGLGANAQAGLGPVWSISAAPRVRLVFTRGLNPIYPD